MVHNVQSESSQEWRFKTLSTLLHLCNRGGMKSSKMNKRRNASKYLGNHHRCMIKQIYGGGILARNYPNLPENFLYFKRARPKTFSPTKITKNNFGMTFNKRCSCVSTNVGRHFFKSNNVGRHFCPYFHGVCPDFQEFCPDFWQIKTFWGALAPPAPPFPTPLGTTFLGYTNDKSNC